MRTPFRRIPSTAVTTALCQPSMCGTGFLCRIRTSCHGSSKVTGFSRRRSAAWQFSGIYVVQSGLPVTFRSGARAGLTDALLLETAPGSQRPDLVGPFNLQFAPNPGGTPTNKVTNSGLAQPLVGHFGTLGRNVARINGVE